MGADKHRRDREKKALRHVRHEHWFLETPAYRALSNAAKVIYTDIAKRYMGSNNGRIPYSVREGAAAANCSKATAMRALRQLQAHGFIVEKKHGAFTWKVKHSSEWLLTEFADSAGAPPTKDFTHWEKQKPVSLEVPNGCRDETARVSR